MTRPRILVAAVVALVVALVGVLAYVVRSGEDVPENAAFVYGDRVVTIAELDQRVDALRALYGVTVPTEAEEKDTFQRSAAKSFALTLILDAEARKRDLSISDKKARDLLDKYVSTNFGNGGREAFVEALGNVGTSEAEVLTEIKRQSIVAELRNAVVGTVSFTDAEVAAQFEKRKDELGTPELRQLKNIVVKDEDQAVIVAQRLEDGEDVAKVAADVSIDESTKASGGDLGYRAAAELEPAVAKAAFAARKGEVYGPAQGSFGWNVGVVAGVREPQKADFDALKAQFTQLLESEEASRRWVAWLATEIRAADIRYAEDYLPENPDSAPGLGSSNTPATSPEASPTP